MRSIFVRYFSGSRNRSKSIGVWNFPWIAWPLWVISWRGSISPILANWKVEEHGIGYPRYIQTRSIFQLSKREFLSFNLMFRDKNENENIFLSVSCFEMRTRISFFQSQASRRERESRLRQLSQECSRMFKNAFILLVSGLIVYNTEKAVNFSKILLIFSQEILMKISRWEQEYFLSISCFKTRTRNRKWFLKVEQEKMKPRGN